MKLSLNLRELFYFLRSQFVVEKSLLQKDLPQTFEFLKKKSNDFYFEDSKLSEVMRFSSFFSRRILFKPPCLRSSLLLFLSAKPPLTLHIAVDNTNSIFKAHAWIEKNGKIYSTLDDVSSFTPMYSQIKNV